MKKKYYKIAISFFLALSIFVIQMFFLNTFQGIFGYINLIIVFLVFILVLYRLPAAILFGSLFGFFLDIFSFSVFGINILSIAITLVLTRMLLAKLFTNRSIYSFVVLSFFATVAYNLITYFFIYLSKFLELEGRMFLFNLEFWKNLSIQLLWSIIISLTAFYFLGIFTNKLRPVFLKK